MTDREVRPARWAQGACGGRLKPGRSLSTVRPTEFAQIVLTKVVPSGRGRTVRAGWPGRGREEWDMSSTKEKKADVIQTCRRTDEDTGSPDVQVAMLTARTSGEPVSSSVSR